MKTPFGSLLVLAIAMQMHAGEAVKITVRDSGNGWPVPLVELRSTHNVRFFTDNAGVVAIDLPELMGVETWFTVESDGYERRADGLGSRGFRIQLDPGSEHELEVDRTIIAKRLGRLTGGGIFGESQKLGERLEWRESGILGCDSIQNAVHNGRMFWAWGDTVVPEYPLGLFHMSSATTGVRALRSFEPPLAVDLQYFRDKKGKVRNVANVAPNDPGPTWVSGYVSLKDRQGDAHLVGCYTKIKAPMTAYRTGLCVWNDKTENFESIRVLWDQADGAERPALRPEGHPVFWTDGEGKQWLLFGNPLPTIRMPATFEAWQDPGTWEALDPREALDSPDGEKIKLHSGSIAWNPFRKKWVTVFVQIQGEPTALDDTYALGDVWYAEADSPLGPWGTAVKILEHRLYTYYNPRIHPEFPPEGSPILLFEGTYTQLFSAAPVRTPRYDYNQILYRLDLDDPKLAPAQK